MTDKTYQAINLVFWMATEDRISVAELHTLMLGLKAEPETIALARQRLEKRDEQATLPCAGGE